VECTIEASVRPDIPYHIRECWLSSTVPPSSPGAVSPSSTICVRLSALDKMVQRLLTTAYIRRISHDEPADTPPALPDRVTRSPAADLESTARDQQSTAPTAPGNWAEGSFENGILALSQADRIPPISQQS